MNINLTILLVPTTINLIPALKKAERGEQSAANSLFRALYTELHCIRQTGIGAPGSPGEPERHHPVAEKDETLFPDRDKIDAPLTKIVI